MIIIAVNYIKQALKLCRSPTYTYTRHHRDTMFSTSPHQSSCSPRSFTTTYPQAMTTTTEQKWEDAGDNAVCDTSAGEVYIADSPGRLPTLKACQEACEDNVDCQSITYFKTGWCSFFSTPCTATTWKGKAISMRLLNPTTTTTTAPTSTPAPATTPAPTTT